MFSERGRPPTLFPSAPPSLREFSGTQMHCENYESALPHSVVPSYAAGRVGV